jgi:hypothetical protein
MTSLVQLQRATAYLFKGRTDIRLHWGFIRVALTWRIFLEGRTEFTVRQDRPGIKKSRGPLPPPAYIACAII